MPNQSSEGLEAAWMRNLREGRMSFRAKHAGKLSWECTAVEMAGENESWNDFDATVADGFDQHRVNL